jgi:predicted phosphodiesterase
VKDIVDKVDPVCILIAGDVFENSLNISPYYELSKLGRPVICCFGNHEFAYRSVEDTFKFYRKLYFPDENDVHYLDIVGHRKIKFNGNDVNVVGNVLWYDSSLKDYLYHGLTKNGIAYGWLDATIVGFDFKKENAKCVEQIKQNYDKTCDNILLTHNVPDRRLNLFSLNGPSMYNEYSGMNNLLDDLAKDGMTFKYAICGHTHRKTNATIDGAKCVNIGNDYIFKGGEISYFVIEEI